MSSKSSEATRDRILEAAWKLLKEGPQSKTRMADVAKEAGVSRQAVYLHFPSRAELLIETTRYIDVKEDVAGQLASAFDAETGIEQLERFVRAWISYIPIVYGGAKSLMAIKDEDPDADAAWQDRMDGLYAACKRVVDALAEQGNLSPDLTTREATDLMWARISVTQWEALTIDRKMSQKRYLELTQSTLLQTLVGS